MKKMLKFMKKMPKLGNVSVSVSMSPKVRRQRAPDGWETLPEHLASDKNTGGRAVREEG